MRISAIVLTKNEEKNIGDCLKSLEWCDEIIMVDDYSEDHTSEVGRTIGAIVYKKHLENDFSAQRNFGLDKASGDWVLFVDADERVSSSLRDEVIKLLSYKHSLKSNDYSLKSNDYKATEYFGFKARRRDVMWGRELKHGETGNVKLLRLARKGSGVWKRKVHETWNISGDIGELKNPIIHYPHQSLKEFILDIDYYSTLHAKALKEEGKRSSLIKILLYPKIKFVQNWVFRFGFLDGLPGFLVAILMSFHSYLAWSKLWLLQRKVTSDK